MNNFDSIWEKVDALLKAHNPCRIEIVQGEAKCMSKATKGKPCCGGCNHLGAHGCTVKSMACKFWLCEEAWWTLPFTAQITMLQLLEAYEGPLNFRHTGERLSKRRVIWRQPTFSEDRPTIRHRNEQTVDVTFNHLWMRPKSE